MNRLLIIFASISLLSGCVHNSPHSEFAKTITFSSLESFSFKHTLVTGMEFSESEEQVLEELSEKVLTEELKARGFEAMGEGADFYAVVKWKKNVSSYPDMFDHIDGVEDSLNRRDHPSYRFASRLHLTVELYLTESRELFWRKDLPNIFDAVQFTEERIIESLKRGIENFPKRVEKDPDLPDIQ